MGCTSSRDKDIGPAGNSVDAVDDECTQQIDGDSKNTPSVPRTRVMSTHIANRADQLSKSFDDGGLDSAVNEETLRKLAKNDQSLTTLRIVNSGMYADMKPSQRKCQLYGTSCIIN